MKKNIIILLLSLFYITGFSQNARYAFSGKFVPSSMKDKLNDAKLISDVIPDCPSHWKKTIDIVSVNIMAICHGQIRSSEGTNERLTEEQKNILNKADMGTDISIKLKFKWRDTLSAVADHGKIQEMNEYRVTVIPETEAEYPGGYMKLTNYLKENIMNTISATYPTNQLPWVTAIFTVNEEGEIVDAKISKPSKDPEVDKTVLDAISKMPKWKPAENSKGIKVKQEFTFRTLSGGC